jgi:hypothetical protein
MMVTTIAIEMSNSIKEKPASLLPFETRPRMDALLLLMSLT